MASSCAPHLLGESAGSLGSSPPSSLPPLLLLPCFVFLLLLQAALGRKSRSLHTHTPPCVQLHLSPVSAEAISMGLCHCSATWLPARPQETGSLHWLLRKLETCSLYRVVGPPLFSRCPSCLEMQGLVSLEGISGQAFSWASQGYGDINHLCLHG